MSAVIGPDTILVQILFLFTEYLEVCVCVCMNIYLYIDIYLIFHSYMPF